MKLSGTTLVLLLALLASGCAPEGGKPDRLNLVLISLDTCRPDRLSCYGAERQTTPNLDAFAGEAVQFTDCLAQSALTAPSHMSMLTGHYVHRHGLLNNQGSRKPPYTLASHLSAFGWRTAAFTGHASFQAKHGLGEGFEVFQSHVDETSTETRDIGDAIPFALQWLDRVEGEPFFLLVHGYDPHCPFWPPEPHRAEYAGWYEGPFKDELDGLCHPRRFGERIQSGEIGAEELRYINDMYDAGVASADVAIGAFLDELAARDLLDSSIVVFTSDHGEVLGNHAWVGHGQVWEEALRVPLMIRYPNGQWAGTIDEPVQHVDLLPTLLASLDQLTQTSVPSLPGLHGIDLLPVVRGDIRELAEDRMRLARVGDEPNQVALRFGTRWKAVFAEAADGKRVMQARLYDLTKDPLEQRNLVEDPNSDKARGRFDGMVRRYLRWREATREEDDRFRGREGAGLTSAEDLQMLEALGYTETDG